LISNGVYSTATPAAIRMAKNKISSLVCLTGSGIPTPRTAAITGTGSYDVDVDKVLKIVEPNQAKRLIVKTNVGTHGKGVMPARSRSEARAIVDGFLANDIPVLLQQFMEPTKKHQYIDLRFIVVDGKVAGAMKRIATKKGEIRANISLGGKGLPYEPSGTEITLAERAAKAIGLNVAGVDIIPSGKKRVVIEVNTSPGFVVEDVSNVNVAKKIIQLAIAGARRGEKTSSQKLVEKLNTPIDLRPVASLPRKLKPLPDKTLKSLVKIKSLPKTASKKA
jgi:ribosomal protein S6--L-glutamate ligase